MAIKQDLFQATGKSLYAEAFGWRGLQQKKMEQQKTRHMKKHKNLVKTIKNLDFRKGTINKSMDVWGVNGSSFCMALPARALHGHSLIFEVFAMQHPQNQDELAT